MSFRNVRGLTHGKNHSNAYSNTDARTQVQADISSGVDFLSCTTTTNVAIARESCRAKIESGLEDLPLQVVRDVDVRDVTPEDLSTSVYTRDDEV